MLVDELRELTNNSKRYQKEYEEIVRKLKEMVLGGLNEISIMGISNVVRNRLEEEELTVIHKHELRHNLSISYDLIEW